LVFIAIALANIGVQGTSRGQKHIQSDCMYAYRRIGSSSSSSRFIERITQTPLMRYVSYCAANRRCIYSCCVLVHAL